MNTLALRRREPGRRHKESSPSSRSRSHSYSFYLVDDGDWSALASNLVDGLVEAFDGEVSEVEL